MKNVLLLILIVLMTVALPVAAQQAKPAAKSLNQLLQQVRQGRVGEGKEKRRSRATFQAATGTPGAVAQRCKQRARP